MAEHIPKDHWEAKPRIEPDSYLAEVYRLAAFCFSSEKLASMEPAGAPWSLGDFALARAESEVSRTLLTVAAWLRIKSDDESWIYSYNEPVGDLAPDLNNAAETIELTLREACNKVIHAQRIHFDKSRNPTTEREFLNPTVYTYGRKSGKHWKATIDLAAFCQSAMQVVF